MVDGGGGDRRRGGGRDRGEGEWEGEGEGEGGGEGERGDVLLGIGCEQGSVKLSQVEGQCFDFSRSRGGGFEKHDSPPLVDEIFVPAHEFPSGSLLVDGKGVFCECIVVVDEDLAVCRIDIISTDMVS